MRDPRTRVIGNSNADNHISNWQRQPQLNREVAGKSKCFWEIAVTIEQVVAVWIRWQTLDSG